MLETSLLHCPSWHDILVPILERLDYWCSSKEKLIRALYRSSTTVVRVKSWVCFMINALVHQRNAHSLAICSMCVCACACLVYAEKRQWEIDGCKTYARWHSVKGEGECKHVCVQLSFMQPKSKLDTFDFACVCLCVCSLVCTCVLSRPASLMFQLLVSEFPPKLLHNRLTGLALAVRNRFLANSQSAFAYSFTVIFTII